VASSQTRRHNGAQKVLKADANGAEDLVSAACGATLVVGDALAELVVIGNEERVSTASSVVASSRERVKDEPPHPATAV